MSPGITKKNIYDSNGMEINSELLEGCRVTVISLFSIAFITNILWNLTLSMVTTLYLLSLFVDVHPHPGPDINFGHLTFCHVNIRSINAKKWSAFVDQVKNKFDIISTSKT